MHLFLLHYASWKQYVVLFGINSQLFSILELKSRHKCVWFIYKEIPMTCLTMKLKVRLVLIISSCFFHSLNLFLFLILPLFDLNSTGRSAGTGTGLKPFLVSVSLGMFGLLLGVIGRLSCSLIDPVCRFMQYLTITVVCNFHV